LTAARAPALGLVALLLALLAPAAAAGGPRWLAPQPISPEGVGAPRVAIDAQGNALASWIALGSGIVVSSRPAGSDAWEPPSTVPAPAAVQTDQIVLDGTGGAGVVWTAAGGGGVLGAAILPSGSDAFGPAQTLSAPGSFVIAPRLATDGRGGMVAVWEERPGTQGNGVVMAATRAPGADGFGPAEALSDPAEAATQPDVALDPAGNAVVVWVGGPGGARSVRARSRPAGGAWAPVVTVSAATVAGLTARVAVDPSGAAVAAWVATGADDTTLQTATRSPAGAWSAPEDLGPALINDPPAALAEPDGTDTIVYTRPDGTRMQLAARVRPPGGAWSATEDLSPDPVALGPALPFFNGERAGAGARGGVVAVWTRAGGTVQAAVKPAGAQAFDPAVDLSSPGFFTETPTAAMAPNGEALALWTQRPSIVPFNQGVVEEADFTSRPGAVLEPQAVQVTALDAPARATAGTIVGLKATLAAFVDPAVLTPQRLVDGSFIDAGPPVRIRGGTATVPVRLVAGANVLRLAYLDRGTPAASPQVSVEGTPSRRTLVPAGTRPIAIALGFGSVWALSLDAAGEGSVIRIDPRSMRAIGDPIPVGRAAALAVGAGGVWVAAARAESPGLRRIDPVTMRVTAEVPFRGMGLVAVGAGGVWTVKCGPSPVYFADCGEQRLLRVDPVTATVTRDIQVVAPYADGSPVVSDLTVGAGSVWFQVSGEDGSATVRLDIASGRTSPVGGSAGTAALAADGTRLWGASGTCALSRAVGSGALAPIVKALPRTERFACGLGVVAGPRDVWVGEVMRGAPAAPVPTSPPTQIARVDARTGRVVGVPVTLGGGPLTFAVGEGAIWVAYADAGVVTRVDPGPAARARPEPRRRPRVTLAGGLWSSPRTLSTRTRSASVPDVAVAGRGRAVAAWLEAQAGGSAIVESAVRTGSAAAWGPARALDRTAASPTARGPGSPRPRTARRSRSGRAGRAPARRSPCGRASWARAPRPGGRPRSAPRRTPAPSPPTSTWGRMARRSRRGAAPARHRRPGPPACPCRLPRARRAASSAIPSRWADRRPSSCRRSEHGSRSAGPASPWRPGPPGRRRRG